MLFIIIFILNFANLIHWQDLYFYDSSIVYLMMTFFSFYDREFEVYAVILVLSPLFCGKISSQFTNPHSRTQICSSNRNKNKKPTNIRKVKIAKILVACSHWTSMESIQNYNSIGLQEKRLNTTNILFFSHLQFIRTYSLRHHFPHHAFHSSLIIK